MGANAKNSAPRQSSSSAEGRHRLPPLKALCAFDAAARHGSFAQGAEELGVTPSAISHQIQLLEDFLGVQLFHRRAGRAAPTSAGLSYAREIAEAFRLIAGATNLVAPRAQRGRLLIAAGPSFAAKWLQPRLPDFMRANPDVRLRLSTLGERDDIETARFDIAITHGRPSAPSKHVEPLLAERYRPMCTPALAAGLALQSPRDLGRATLIHSANALTWADYLREGGLADLRPQDELWLDRSTMAIEAALAGMGVVLESEILAEEELRGGRLIMPFGRTDHGVETTSYYLVKPRRHGAAPIDAFEAWLRASLAAAVPSVVAAAARSPTTPAAVS